MKRLSSLLHPSADESDHAPYRLVVNHVQSESDHAPYTYEWSRPVGLNAIVSDVYCTAHTSIGDLDSGPPSGTVVIAGNTTIYELYLPRQKVGYHIAGVTMHLGDQDYELGTTGDFEPGYPDPKIRAAMVMNAGVPPESKP